MAGTAIGSMRGSKLSAKEAALLTGELKKPSWQSRNEGIHERVSFEDSIWGFDLAGGAYYKTPLRVTMVKRDSRADKAGIRPGDQLLRINDIDTSTLTIQEAHEIIIESGIYIRLAVSAPDDLEDSYNCYQDPTEEIAEMERQRKAEEEAERWRRIQSKFKQANWSLQWPWVSKRRIIYKESNCFMVPSKYEDRHREKFGAFNSALKKDQIVELFSKQTHTPTGEKKQAVFPEEVKAKENTNDPTILKKDDNNNYVENDKINNVDNSIHKAIPAVNDNNEPKDRSADEVNEEKNEAMKEELSEENDIDELYENSEVDEDKEFDEWDPNDNEEQNEEDMEEIFNDEEYVNEEDQNTEIEDVLNEVEYTESRKFEI